jgi:hypothetical protein
VGDYDYPLEDIERVLLVEGYLLLFLPGDLDSELEATVDDHWNLIADVACRFASLTLFAPISLLGRGLVLCATQVHAPYVSGSAKRRENEKSVGKYISRMKTQIDDQFMLPWTDLEVYNHKKCAYGWNIF